VGRALFTASRFPKIINKETLETLLEVTANALLDNQNPIIRVSAMKSIYCFCEELTAENQESLLMPPLPQITEGLIQMISQNSTNQIGYLTMETLLIVLGINEEYVGTIEAKICPFAIALFIKNTNGLNFYSMFTKLNNQPKAQNIFSFFNFRSVGQLTYQ